MSFRFSRVAVLTLAGAVLLAPLATEAALIPIQVTGFNQDVIVETGAVDDPTTHYQSAITASMDNGVTRTGNAWYERGFNTAAPTTGLPNGGVVTVSESDPTLSFVLQSATTNNALLLDTANSSGRLTLTTPVPMTRLAILAASGNGGVTSAPVTVNFSDGTPAASLTYTAGDWFNQNPIAVTAMGRVNASAGTVNNVGAANPRLYNQTLLDLTGFGTHPVASLDFGWNGTGNTHTAIMALSGETIVPEPATPALLAVAAFGLFARRRRTA
jgi:hypothetical protein